MRGNFSLQRWWCIKSCLRIIGVVHAASPQMQRSCDDSLLHKATFCSNLQQRDFSSISWSTAFAASVRRATLSRPCQKAWGADTISTRRRPTSYYVRRGPPFLIFLQTHQHTHTHTHTPTGEHIEGSQCLPRHSRAATTSALPRWCEDVTVHNV